MLTPKERRSTILYCSVERFLNSAIAVGKVAEKQLKKENDREDASILWQDAEELKPLLEALWAEEKERICKR